MTSSKEQNGAIEPLPPMLSSMWRLCKLGYRHEPRLMAGALALSQVAALPDALLALWLMLLGVGVVQHRPGLVVGSAIGLGVSAGRNLVSSNGQYALPAALSRQGDDRARIARRATASHHRDGCAPGTAGVSR